MKRLFFALEVSDLNKNAIAQWVEIAIPCLKAPVKTDNFHLTLSFLGSITPEVEQILISELINLKTEVINLVFNNIGYFKKPKVLYLKPEKTPQALYLLVQQFNKMVLDAGLSINYFNYQPHITIARKVTELPTVKFPLDLKIVFTHIVLYQSISSSSGVKYIKLKSWPL
ncbi:RNA 2',3'-cyclic phosphodiesterase [Pseudoalteromonas denitrificans]|jgi:2'-5' RNA ligase|uniref:RNA 2',3'-cyclic phosphodiesterase n=1 Tax=Pseudoalteromonas denitrificans DSM 6059 TaxID=1123010 RepID=A0A1I1RTH3_9GAMM|nr:RNA 2',3'-cyclic phosphodiesterase [Pseudoalteromonas denitrificans]SFD37666.1 2'-5' RNA ligase [Pseudoalteromonas denitrificans DSM 6059]